MLTRVLFAFCITITLATVWSREGGFSSICSNEPNDPGCLTYIDFFKTKWDKDDLDKYPTRVIQFFNHSDALAEVLVTTAPERIGIFFGAYVPWNSLLSYMEIGKYAWLRNDDYVKVDESSLFPNAQREQFYQEFAEQLDGFYGRMSSLWGYKRDEVQKACNRSQPQKMLPKIVTALFQCQPLTKSDIQKTEQLLGLFDEIEQQSGWVAADSANDDIFEMFAERYLFGSNKTSNNDSLPLFDETTKILASEKDLNESTINLFRTAFGAAQERLAQAENRQKDGYEELKDKYVRWATTRGLNDSDSEERQNGARVFVKSFYGIERSDALKKLSEKVAVIEIESPPCEFCIMDQLKSAYYLEPEKFMLLTRVLLQDLQTIYNNANICRLFNEAGYDVAEEGAFDNIDKMAIDTFMEIYKNMRARMDYLDTLRENGRH